LIIVEGPDGGGKTVLAKSLSAVTGWDIGGKVVDSDTKPMTDLRVWTENNLDRGYHPGIYDRHRLISEPIYSTVIPDRKIDEDFWNPDWLASAMYRFHLISPFVILCMPPGEEVAKNVFGDDKNSVVAPHIARLYRAYFHYGLIHSEVNVHWWNYTAHGEADFNNLLSRILTHSHQRMEPRDRHSLDQLASAVRQAHHR